MGWGCGVKPSAALSALRGGPRGLWLVGRLLEQGGRWLGGHGAIWWRPNQCRGGRSEGREMSLGFASVGFFEFLEFPPAPGPGARSSWPRFLSSADHSRGLRLSVSRERRGDAGESWPEAAGPRGAWAAGAGQCRARRCCARRAIDSGIPPVGPPRGGEGERGCVFLIKCDFGGGGQPLWNS